jgi:hypothetical protein
METSDWQHYSYTVGQLKEKLAQFPDDTPIVMSSDAEGNSHSPLSYVGPAHYLAERPWSGDIMDTREDWERDAHEFSERSYEEYIENAVPVVLLGPVN